METETFFKAFLIGVPVGVLFLDWLTDNPGLLFLLFVVCLAGGAGWWYVWR